MEQQQEYIQNLKQRLTKRIHETPTGDLRNLLCDLNIILHLDNSNVIRVDDLEYSESPDIYSFNSLHDLVDAHRKI